MSDLLDKAIDAHGGWQRWQAVNEIVLDMHAVGVWHMKGWPNAFAQTRVVVDTHRQYAEYSPFIHPGQRGVFEGNRTRILSADDSVVSEQSDALSTFKGHTLMTPWGEQQLIYFGGYAIWTYLTTPFLFRMDGFKSKEIEPWEEGDHVWRRLKVEFPDYIRSHSREQTFYFDDHGLLQRHDYSVDILGGTSSANYATEHKTFDGLVFPTRRRVYATTPDNRPNLERVAVAIDIQHIELS